MTNRASTPPSVLAGTNQHGHLSLITSLFPWLVAVTLFIQVEKCCCLLGFKTAIREVFAVQRESGQVSGRVGSFCLRQKRRLLRTKLSSQFHLFQGSMLNSNSRRSRLSPSWVNIRGGSNSNTENNKTASPTVFPGTHPVGGVINTSTNSTYKVSAYAIRGERPYMEDEYFVSNVGHFAAIFDGHGGHSVSNYLRQNLYANLQAALSIASSARVAELRSGDIVNGTLSELEQARAPPALATSVDDCVSALQSALSKVDKEVQCISHWSFQGSTVVAVLVHEDKCGARTVISANIGDSRAVLSRNGTAIDLTKDHKPNNPEEKARVESLGGKVEWSGLVDKYGKPVDGSGVYRINGNLALSRAIGDRSERPLVNAEAHISTASILPSLDEFVLLASDGVWDVMSSREAVSFVHSMLDLPNSKAALEKGAKHSCVGHIGIDRVHSAEHQSEFYGTKRTIMQSMARFVADEALRRGSTDNISVVIIWLRNTLPA